MYREAYGSTVPLSLNKLMLNILKIKEKIGNVI
jgi:hypothetical protein